MSTKHHDGQFVISTNKGGHWYSTDARTLHGAKNIAGRMCFYTKDTHVQIAICRHWPVRYEVVATKEGTSPWKNV